jgi:hypothetical protein
MRRELRSAPAPTNRPGSVSRELAAELADLLRVDQAPYAFRLVGRPWSLRRWLTGRGGSPSALVIIAAGGGIGAYAVVIG